MPRRASDAELREQQRAAEQRAEKALNAHRAADTARAARTHRLCDLGGAVESAVGVGALTKPQVQELIACRLPDGSTVGEMLKTAGILMRSRGIVE